MSTIFRNPPSPALDSNTHYHARSLHQNCFLAPPHARNTPPPSNKYAVSPSGFVSIGSPSTPTCSSPNTAAGSDYFNLSRNSTPTTTPGGYSNPPPGDLDPNLTTAKFRLKTLVPPMKKNGSASVSLQPFTTADAPALAILFERCFATDELRLTAKPPHKTNPSDPLEERRWRICQYTLALQIPGNHIVMAVDESAERKIIGVAGFFGPGGIQWTIKGPDGGNAVGEAVPSHWDMDMKARIDEVVDKAREEALKGDYNVWGTFT
ncbi:hypothetical protein P280DRAFT_465310 [Massarina eburnea CBS 473.64]|uniref:N-acetyltransferase domain-containing protein n=1 Tax=Massarina eburnea CBS 473.64 TaxID=1395130 RepID=A0A6A6SDV6_9PLEO|nr:hypothetical protein P280DRAFT_465310 [Massarina eburnea CBS 473.64]